MSMVYILNDLYMEHLNRLLKTALQGLGANKTGATIMKSAKVLGVTDPALANFDSENEVTDIARGHGATKSARDMKVIGERAQSKINKLDLIFSSFSVRSQNYSYKNIIVFRLARHLCSSTSLVMKHLENVFEETPGRMYRS